MAKKKKYAKLGADVKTIGIKEAKDLLGWTEGTEEEPLESGDRVYSINGRNVRLDNNLKNRPMQKSLVTAYVTEIIRGKWRINGEPIILNCYGAVEDGQHRLTAVVVANEMWEEDPERFENLEKGPFNLETIVVTGIEPSPEVTNTINTGRKRTTGDVFFRANELADLSPGKQKQVSNILAQAVRLVWLRCGGKTVSDAPKLPISEAVDFLNRHPKLRDSVKFIWNLNQPVDGGAPNRVKRHMSLPYATAIHYLASTRLTDPNKYVEDGKVDTGETRFANEFFELLASDANEKEEPIIHCLQRLLWDADQYSGKARDYLVNLVINGYLYWYDNGDEQDGMDYKTVRRAIKPKTIKVDRNGVSVTRLKPDAYAYLGGLDIDWAVWESENYEEEDEEDEVYEEDASHEDEDFEEDYEE